jgi:hypothetical protein
VGPSKCIGIRDHAHIHANLDDEGQKRLEPRMRYWWFLLSVSVDEVMLKYKLTVVARGRRG